MQEPLGATVLVVEDDLMVRGLIQSALQSIGCEVVEAVNGVEALRLLDEIAPDLILCDLLMPEIGGLELLRELRAYPETESIPFIVVSALREIDDITKGFDLGADDYIVKPFSVKELQARVRAKIKRPPIPVHQVRQNRLTGMLSHAALMAELEREFVRAQGRKETGWLTRIAVSEHDLLDERLGRRAEAAIGKQLMALVTFDSLPAEMIGHDVDDGFLLYTPEISAAQIHERLNQITRRVVGHTFVMGDELLRLTPVIGCAPIANDLTVEQWYDHAQAAFTYAALQLDLEPVEYASSMDALAHATKAQTQVMKQVNLWTRMTRNGRLTFQISATLVLGLVIPFFVYAFLGANGFDISQEVYILVVVALLGTAALIWWEGLLAQRRVDPPEVADGKYPAASAIIAAYLPNEAATIEATIEAFLKLDYPGDLKVIVAYNTPRVMPIERIFQEIAAKDPRFLPLKVAGSTSKAQNVNAALTHVDSAFVGVFDADHHPDPGSFQRAWRWLASGYDVVQGHCLVRNGDASWVARTVAVEFESIYGVSHPGRMRFHDFGIFGGSNGFWKTRLLRETRMHSFMLTEDIDSSFRVVERGYKIASDPYLISRELAPTRLKALWNQRLRWAQGWFQVAQQRTMPLLRSPELTRRQKLGIFHLLVWREIYPWISIQVIPIVIYWAVTAGGFDRIDWFVPIFVVTSIVTLGTGPGQLVLIYRLADAQIKKQRGWFWWYLLVSFIFYTEFKNVIGRVAQVKQMMGERVWKSTPRT